MIALPSLPLAIFRLHFQTDQDFAVRFPGSAWRGALGHHLRQLACLTGARDCSGCGEIQRCSYSYIFDTPVPPDALKMRRYTQAPHPFILREERPGHDFLHLYLTLIGRANAQLPLMVLALNRAALNRLGINGRQMKLLAVDQQDENTIWHRIDQPGGALTALPPKTPLIPLLNDGPVVIEFLSPLRVKRAGHHVRPQDFQFADLFSSLLRRISMLTTFHTENAFETDFRALMEAAWKVPVDTSLHWVDLPRHSFRQQADMNLGGVMGSLKLGSAELVPFWPILWLGQYTHAGGAATMGLGHYTVRQAASLREGVHDVQMDDTGGIASPL